LRLPWCGAASVAIRNYFNEQSLANSTVMINKKPLDHTGTPNERLGHVTMWADDLVVDMTAGQFMSLVGLTHEVALDHNLEHLYPAEKIFIYKITEAREAANTFAEHAYSLDRNGLIPQPKSVAGMEGVLRGRSLKEMQRVYQSIWNPDLYEQWPDDEFTPMLRDAASSIKSALNSRQ
jgi:hypothetical protein